MIDRLTTEADTASVNTGRDNQVRLYVHTSSGYEVRDTATASFLARRPGRTRVVVRSQQRRLSDSTLLVVEEEP